MSTEQTPKAVVVIPTYNESGSLGGVLDRTLASGAVIDVLVVDDNSPDGTGDLADGYAERHPSVHVLHRPGKGGLAGAYVAGIQWALERGYDTVVEMDADGSHDPADLPRMLKLSTKFDLVIGSRWVPGGKVVNWPWRRRVLSKGGSWYTRNLFSMGVSDTSGGFRAYKAEVLKNLRLDEIDSRGYCFHVDCLRRTLQAGYHVVEMPITFTERVEGVSKMTGSIILESMMMITRWGVRYRLDSLLHRRTAGHQRSGASVRKLSSTVPLDDEGVYAS
ncbi:polyprenol monophosphomannose synthase [Frondihabitans cladoniiphilus]|uniref:Polyprenol monophosphomannose synthase n=1 Tax=Frondihabitans cladoniiphilus TaxID=715785 RepID=A0ABP8VRX5_9MICO